MPERTISVKLSARVEQYVAAMSAAQKATGVTAAELKNIERVGGQLQSVGRMMTTYITTPLALMGGAAVASAVNWESAWAGVTKTVNGTTSELAMLEDQLRGMSLEVPASHREIAAVAEAAGALGVATPNIAKFTRVMIDLGETTNLSADEAATAIAQLMNVMQTAPGQVGNLGAALVDLGNNGASTEREILMMAQRIAGAGEIVGLTEADVLGFSNALASVGIEAEAGGSAFSRVITDMSKAVAQGGSELATFARVAGVSAQEFARSFRDDPAAAIASFIQGLGDIEAAGGNVFSVLDELGLSDVRVSRALLTMATSGDLLTESLNLSADAWQANTALTEEAAKRYETTAARFQMVRNQVVDTFIDIGEMLLPAVEMVVDGIGAMALGFQTLPGPIQGVVLGFAGLVAAVGPLTYLTGTMMKNWRSLVGVFGLTGTAATRAGAAFGVLGLAVAGVSYIWGQQRQRQEEAERVIGLASDALENQTQQAWANVDATGAAASSTLGLTVANEGLLAAVSAIVAENDGLRDSLVATGMSYQDALDTILAFSTDPVDGFVRLADAIGISEEQARSLASVTTSGELDWAAIYEGASASGLLTDEFRLMEQVYVGLVGRNAEYDTSLQETARRQLENQVLAGGLARELVGLAAANTGQALATGDAVQMWVEYQRLLGELTPQQRAAIVQSDALAAATAASGESAAGAVDATEALSDALEVLGVRWQRAAVMDRFWEAPRAGMAELAELAGHTGFEMLLLQEAVMKAAASGEPLRDVLIEQAMAFGRNEQQAGLLADMLGPTAEAMLAVYRAAAQMNGEIGKQIPIVDKWAAGFKNADVALKGLSAEPADTGWMKGMADSLERIDSVRLVGIRDATSELVTLGDVMDRARGQADDFRRALDNLTNPHIDLVEAQAAVRAMMGSLNSEIESGVSLYNEHTGALNLDSEAVRSNLSIINDAIGVMQDEAAAQVARGEGVDVATEKLASNTEEFIENAVAAGVNRDELIRYLDSINALPDDAVTTIELIGQEYAKEQVGDFKNALAGVPPSKGTLLYATSDKSGIDSFKYALASIPSSKTVQILTSGGGSLKSVRSATGRFVPGGTNMLSTLGELPGARGNEVVFPLGDPDRMRELWSIPQVHGPLLSAVGAQMAAASNVVHGDTIVDVRVFNNGRELSGSDVARAIMREMASA